MIHTADAIDLAWLESRFHAAVEMSEPQRAEFLERECGSDSRKRSALLALLQADSRGGTAVDRAARTVLGLDRARIADAPLAAGARIGRYEVVRPLGVGGMGAVYEALQDEPRRTVALKLLRGGFASESALRRFRQEAEILGRLQHPAIAQIYEAGLHGVGGASAPYFAMELVRDARDVLRYARTARLDMRARLDVFLRICEAVEHAHQRGVIHRDLKPGNLLVDRDGRPKIIDYGVARMIEAGAAGGPDRTMHGEFVGTLQYMAPEQLRAERAACDTRTDIYSLGLVLFELLTDQRPIDLAGLAWADAIRAIETTPPPDAGRLHRALRGDLATILNHALEKQPEARYASVGEFAGDLRRFLRDEPILARAATPAQRLFKFVRRNRTWVGAAGLAFASLAGGALLATWKAAEADAARQRSELESRRAQLTLDFLQDMLDAGDTRNLGADTTMLAAIDRAGANLAASDSLDPGVRANLHQALGRAYMRMGERTKAATHLHATVAARRAASMHAETDCLLASALLDAAWDNRAQSLDQQLAMFDESMDIYRRIRGVNDPYIGAILSYMAGLEIGAGRVEAGLAHVRQALAELRQSTNPRDPAIAYAQIVLGDGLLEVGRVAEAQAAFLAAVAHYRSLPPPVHPEVAMALRRLARLAEQAGDSAAALEYSSAARAIEPHWRGEVCDADAGSAGSTP